MVWAGISTEAKTALVMVENGSLNGARYIEDKLADHVVPFGPFIGDSFLLMHDNARAHVAHAVFQNIWTMLIFSALGGLHVAQI